MPLAYRYLGFLQHALNAENGRFRNFMSYRSPLAGRSRQRGLPRPRALGTRPDRSRLVLVRAWPARRWPSSNGPCRRLSTFTSPRAWAYALLGIDAYLGRFGGASEVRRARLLLAERLCSADSARQWRRLALAGDNGHLRQRHPASRPDRLRCAPSTRPDMVETGTPSLHWLLHIRPTRRVISCRSAIAAGWCAARHRRASTSSRSRSST